MVCLTLAGDTVPDFDVPGLVSPVGTERWHALLDRADGVRVFKLLLERDDVTLVAHNAPFDLAVLAEAGVGVRKIFEGLEARRFRDTLIREKLIAIGTDRLDFDPRTGKRPAFNLAELVDGYFGVDISASKASKSCKVCPHLVEEGDLPAEPCPSCGTWRLCYHRLDGVPVDAWPAPARDYAIEDAEWALRVHTAQAEPLLSSAGLDIVREDGSVVDEDNQLRAGFALHLMAAHGVLVDNEKATAWGQELEAACAEMDAAGRRAGFIRPNGTKDMKRLYALVEQCYGDSTPRTEKGNVKTDRDTLLGSGHPDLVAFADPNGDRKNLTTYLPILQAAEGHPLTSSPNVLVATGRTSWRSPNLQNCFDGATEILTLRGWVRFDQLLDGDSVAQWEDGQVTFVVPERVVRSPYRGEMVSLRKTHVSLLVTPEHRCPTIERKTGKLQVHPAQAYPRDAHQLHGGRYSGPGLPLSDVEIQLLVVMQADGSWHDQGIDFSFWKARKKQRILELLNATNLPVSEGTSSDPERLRVRVLASDGVDKLHAYLGDKKLFGPWVLEMSQRQLEVFTEEVWHWDGCYTRKNHYASQHKQNADWVQIAHTLLGIRARIRLYSCNKTPSWQVDVTRRNYSGTANILEDRVSWDGTVYCVTVPSGFVVVRRDGCTAVSGNSPRGTLFRECFVPRHGKVFVSVDYDTIELRALAQVHLWWFGKSAMADALIAGEDLHLSLGAQLLGIPYAEAQARLAAGDEEVSDARQNAKMCFAAGTEVLTRTGWVRIEDVTTGHEIAAVVDIPERRTPGGAPRIAWQHPLRTAQRWSDNVIRVYNKQFDLVCTADHEVPSYLDDAGPLRRVEMQDLNKARYHLKSAVAPGDVEADEILLRLAVATQADGNIYVGRTAHRPSIRFGFKNPRKIERLEMLLQRAGICHRTSVSKEGVYIFNVGAKVAGPILDLLGENKTLPSWWCSLTPELRHVVLEEVGVWDAKVREGKNSYLYTSKDKQSAETLFRMAALTGWRGVLCEKHMTYKGLPYPYYEVSILPRADARSVVKYEQQPAQQVYCLTVPAGYMIVRGGEGRERQGHLVVSNCNFGFPGGLSAETFVVYSAGMGHPISLEAAQRLRDTWFERWPEMADYFNVIGEASKWDRFCLTQPVSLRQRAGCSFTSGSNSFFQGLVADGAKAAVWALSKAAYTGTAPLKGVRPWVFLHDEIITEGPLDTLTEWADAKTALMIEAMERYIPDIPITAAPAAMTRWRKGAKEVRIDGRLVPWEPKE